MYFSHPSQHLLENIETKKIKVPQNVLNLVTASPLEQVQTQAKKVPQQVWIWVGPPPPSTKKIRTLTTAKVLIQTRPPTSL